MAETWSVQELLQAGWSEADLAWEATAERTAEAVARERSRPGEGRGGRGAADSRARASSRSTLASAPASPISACACDLSGRQRRRYVPVSRGARRVARRRARGSPAWTRRAWREARCFICAWSCVIASTYRARWQERWREIAAEAKARIEDLAASPGDLARKRGRRVWRAGAASARRCSTIRAS